MAGPDDDTDKSHEPTRHKLEEARKKGDIARSTDLNTAAAYGGVLLAALAAGSASVERVSSGLMALLDRPGALARLVFEGSGAAPLSGLFLTVGLGLLAWFLIPAGCALASVLAQRSFVVAHLTRCAPNCRASIRCRMPRTNTG